MTSVIPDIPEMKKRNIVRTNLLIMVSKEFGVQKKTCETKINSRTLTNAEKEFEAQNEHSVILKSQSFSGAKRGLQSRPNDNIINTIGDKLSSKTVSNSSTSSISQCINSASRGIVKMTSLKIPTSMSRTDSNSSFISQDSSCVCFNEPVKRKTIVSGKKLNYFTQNTLEKLKSETEIDLSIYKEDFCPSTSHSNRSKTFREIVEENVDYINTESSFGRSEKVRNRSKQGFEFLRNLAKKLKIKKTKTKFSSLSQVKEFNIPKFSQSKLEEDKENKMCKKDSNYTGSSNFVILVNGSKIDNNNEAKSSSNNLTQTRNKLISNNNGLGFGLITGNNYNSIPVFSKTQHDLKFA